MSIIRNAKRRHYVAIDNATVEDIRLSWAARGLLTYLLSKPPDWQVSARQLMAAGPVGRDGVYAILRELAMFGYARAIPKRINGMFAGYDWEIREIPDTDNPHTAPHPALPDTVDPDTAIDHQSLIDQLLVPHPPLPDTAQPDTAQPDTAQPYPAQPYPVKPYLSKTYKDTKTVLSKTDKDSKTESSQESMQSASADCAAAPENPGAAAAPICGDFKRKVRPVIGPADDDDSGIIAFLPLLGTHDYAVSERMADRYQSMYPAADVEQQLRAMWGWLEAKPERRKTPRGIKAFIVNWLNKEQNRGGQQRHAR